MLYVACRMRMLCNNFLASTTELHSIMLLHSAAKDRIRNEACFGNGIIRLFHFLAIGDVRLVTIPNCRARCAIMVDMNEIHEPLVCSEDEEEVDENEYKPLNPFHREDVTIDLVIQAPYNELKDLLSEGQFPNAVRQKLVKSLRNLIDDILEADRVLLHIHAFNSDPVFYTIPIGVSTKIPIFTLEDKTKEMSVFLGILEADRVLLHIHAFNSDPVFYTIPIGVSTKIPIFTLEDKTKEMSVFLGQKWVHMHAERVVLRSSNLPFNMFGLKNDIDCRVAEDKLHDLLREQSSFCLVQKQTYVTFVYGKNSDVPVYFYMIKVTLEAPCLILRTAFLGGISGTERRNV
ncbi:hypothetical protein OSTOST_05418, partial [Ostertagia ostertagi]